MLCGLDLNLKGTSPLPVSAGVCRVQGELQTEHSQPSQLRKSVSGTLAVEPDGDT